MLINNKQFRGPYYYNRNFEKTFACVYAIVMNKKLIYVGITNNINERMANHHKMDCWREYSSNTRTLYTYKEAGQNNREIIERNIINKYNPPCNDK